MIKDGSGVRLYSKSGAEYSNKLPGMRKAFAELPTNSAILDGEVCLIDPRGVANFYRSDYPNAHAVAGRKVAVSSRSKSAVPLQRVVFSVPPSVCKTSPAGAKPPCLSCRAMERGAQSMIRNWGPS